MSEPFISELRLMSLNFPPKGWLECNGQLLPINQNQALFSLLGTTYGGNGQTTFALPDLRGRVPLHVGGGFTQGTQTGQELHTLTLAELPAHTHALQASSVSGDQAVPTNRLLAGANNLYRAPSDPTTLNPASLAPFGGGQAHENRHPFLTLNWCIAVIGVFPSRN